MNKRQVLVQHADTQLIESALGALRDSCGAIGNITDEPTAYDARVSIRIAGEDLLYNCEVKTMIDRYLTLEHLKARTSGQVPAPLLVSTSLTNALAIRCRELDLQFIDTAGNAYLTNKKGVLINIMGNKREAKSIPALRETSITPGALRMMFAFLADPAMLNAPYRALAHASQVSIGAVGNVFDTLEARGFLGKTDNGVRIIKFPEQMLREWASGYLSRLRPKLRKFHFTTADPAFFQTWDPGLHISAWGGEMAADILTGHLKPGAFIIYMDMEADPGALSDLVKRYRLRADPNGAIEVVQPFWNMNYFDQFFPSVPPHLAYADLLGTHDSRNLDVAKLLADQAIDHVQNSGR